jgi:hypothetical protein
MYLTKDYATVVVKQIMELRTPTAISHIHMTACEEHVFTEQN